MMHKLKNYKSHGILNLRSSWVKKKCSSCNINKKEQKVIKINKIVFLSRVFYNEGLLSLKEINIEWLTNNEGEM